MEPAASHFAATSRLKTGVSPQSAKLDGEAARETIDAGGPDGRARASSTSTPITMGR